MARRLTTTKTKTNTGKRSIVDPSMATSMRLLLAAERLIADEGVAQVSMRRINIEAGTGFYEQRLVNEQVAQLTGYRRLANYTSDEAQYQALMSAGVTFAQAHQLRVGIALSAEQVASLTSDMVWLVQREVTLADGSKQKVLVPQVYALARAGDLF